MCDRCGAPCCGYIHACCMCDRYGVLPRTSRRVPRRVTHRAAMAQSKMTRCLASTSAARRRTRFSVSWTPGSTEQGLYWDVLVWWRTLPRRGVVSQHCGKHATAVNISMKLNNYYPSVCLSVVFDCHDARRTRTATASSTSMNLSTRTLASGTARSISIR